MAGFPRRGLEGISPRDLAWLTGSWRARMGDDAVEEHWSGPGGDTMMAMFRWVREGKVLFYEIEVIEEEDGLVFLRVKHFDRGLVGWEEKDAPHEFVLVELDDRGAVFLERDRPDPRWAVYRRKGQKHLTAYFTHGTEPDEHPGVFEFVRG